MNATDAPNIKPGDSIRRISSMQALTVTENNGREITAILTVKIPVGELHEWKHTPKP